MSRAVALLLPSFLLCSLVSIMPGCAVDPDEPVGSAQGALSQPPSLAPLPILTLTPTSPDPASAPQLPAPRTPRTRQDCEDVEHGCVTDADKKFDNCVNANGGNDYPDTHCSTDHNTQLGYCEDVLNGCVNSIRPLQP